MKSDGLSQWQGWGVTILRVVGLMSQLEIPLPTLSAVVVTAVEFLGGAALLLGLFTRWVAIPLTINMLVAILAVHLRAGFFLPNGYEYALTLMTATMTLAFAGSGEAAIDKLFSKR